MRSSTLPLGGSVAATNSQPSALVQTERSDIRSINDLVPESGTFLRNPNRLSSGSLTFSFASCHSQVSYFVAAILDSSDLSLDPMIRSDLSTALRELILNAIEHGNFELSYSDKSAALLDGTWMALLAQRSAEEPFQSRRVHVCVDWSDKQVAVVIRDEGFGFDWRSLPDPTAVENLLSEHGRGVTLARFCVDELVYNEAGNEVQIRKSLCL